MDNIKKLYISYFCRFSCNDCAHTVYWVNKDNDTVRYSGDKTRKELRSIIRNYPYIVDDIEHWRNHLLR